MEPNELYQYSIFNAITGGVGDDGPTIGELTERGNHGLGTFRQMDGEMVMVDGEIYQITADGGVLRRTDDIILPFAQVTRFQPVNARETGRLDDDLLRTALLSNHPSCNNLFISIRIDGTFEEISTHIVRRQEYSGQPGTELIKKMKHETLRNVTGTAFGFRSPQHAGFSSPGVHLHFISSDRQIGGHMITFKMARGTLSSCAVNNVRLELPQTSPFNEIEFGAAPSTILKS
jgi:alpha-acetolactate decarboxylase